MHNILLKVVLFFSFSIFFWSCGEGGIFDSSKPEVPPDNRAKLFLSIDESNFDVTVSIKNFDSNIRIASFTISYNTDVFTYTKDNYESKGGVTPFYHNVDEEGTMSFTYDELGGGDKDILLIHFIQIGNLEWVEFRIMHDFSFKDALGNSIYGDCSNLQYQSEEACILHHKYV